MAEVIFSHPMMPQPLYIDTKPDQITWAYGLNTAVYPTYGGEVVQILSVYFDDMQIAGTVGTYAEMEAIYSWFIAYMQYATQGVTNPSFNQQPVTFYYPQRDWTFQIWPKALPGFKYGREIVAPTWSLVAAVKEPDATVADQIKNYAVYEAANTGGVAEFGKTTANFGDTGDLVNNPWASPNGAPGLTSKTISAYLATQLTDLADSFSGFVGDYSTDAFTSLPEFPDISKAAPTAATTTSGSQQGTTTVKTGKRVGP